MEAALEEAVELAGIVAKTSWGDRTGAEAAVAALAAERLVRLAETIRAQALDRVATSREHEVEGHRSAAAWFQSHSKAKRSTACRAQRQGRWLRRLPAAEDAARQGRVSADHLEVIAKVSDRVPTAGFAAVEPWLVECAETMRFTDFVTEARYVVDRLDPDAADARADRMWEDRYVNPSRSFEGGGTLENWLDPLSFATVTRELERLETELFELDWAEAAERLGSTPTPEDLGRSPGQRRAAALVLMAQRSGAYSGRVGPAWCVNLHMSWATWFAELARLEGRTDVAFPEDSLCELDDGTVIPASLAVNAALAGWVRRCVLGPTGEILDYGRARRLFTGVQRQAIIAKISGRRCSHEFGCDVPATECEIDHVVEYEDGGLTDVANGDLLCRHHNRWKHRHKRQRPRDGPDPP